MESYKKVLGGPIWRTFSFIRTPLCKMVTSNTSTVTYHEGGDYVLLVTDAQFSDIDNTTFNGGSINVEIDPAVIGDNVNIFSNSKW